MALDENWNVSRMEPAVAGGPHNGDLEANQCSVDNISNPDNLQILNDGRVIIGEDTGAHENNMIWVWQPKT
jgi:secreted PhoX family phosphatase